MVGNRKVAGWRRRQRPGTRGRTRDPVRRRGDPAQGPLQKLPLFGGDGVPGREPVCRVGVRGGRKPAARRIRPGLGQWFPGFGGRGGDGQEGNGGRLSPFRTGGRPGTGGKFHRLQGRAWDWGAPPGGGRDRPIGTGHCGFVRGTPGLAGGWPVRRYGRGTGSQGNAWWREDHFLFDFENVPASRSGKGWGRPGHRDGEGRRHHHGRMQQSGKVAGHGVHGQVPSWSSRSR